VIKNRSLPFQNEDIIEGEIDMKEALAFVTSIPLTSSNRFATMTDDEIKQERLNTRLQT